MPAPAHSLGNEIHKDVFSFFDAAALLAVVTAFMYFVGYMYHRAYYHYFAVDLAMFPRAGADYIITAWEYAFWSIFCLLLLAFLRSAIICFLPPLLIEKARSKIFPSVLPALWVFAFAILLGSAVKMEQRGARDAKADADKKKIVRIATIGGLLLPDEVYFLSYSQGKYLLYYFPTPYVRPIVIVVNDSAVAKIEFPRVNATEGISKRG